MDGVQRNFSMMAEKIDRMRCLRERCDNYVRLIKLTLDESIREQNSLLDGSAIHNRLKYLGLVDNPTPSGHCGVDKARPTSLDFVDECKYLQVFDRGRSGLRRPQPCKTIAPVNCSSSVDDASYGGYKPRVHRHSSAVYGEIASRAPTAKYAETASFRSPQEYRVYCFPTSVPTVQYPRQTAGRFYRRKPVEQYAQEEASSWGPRRRPEPVSVVEPVPFYTANDHGYRSRTAMNDYRRVDGENDGDPWWAPEIPSRYLDRGHADYYGDYCYRDADSARRPFSGLTRPCSPVYAVQCRSDRTPHYPGDSGSLLEKKIRDYVWSPRCNERVENIGARSSDFERIPRDRGASRGDESVKKWRGQDTTPGENACERNPVVTSPAEKSLTDGVVPGTRKDDDRPANAGRTTHKKISETPARLAKRISFDLDNEDVPLSDRKNSVGYKYTDDDSTKNDGKLNLAGKDVNPKVDDTRRTSIMSNNDRSMSKRRDLSGDSSGDSRRPPVRKHEKLASAANSFESDKYSNSQNNFDGNDSLEKNVHAYNYSDVEKVHDGHDDDTTSVLKMQDDHNQNAFNDFPIETTNPSFDSSGRKLSEVTENFDFVNRAENVSNRSSDVDVTKRRESRGKSIKENASISRKNSIDTDDKQYTVYKDNDEKELSENVTNSPMENRNYDYDADNALDESNVSDTKPDVVNAVAARNGAETVSAADVQNNYYADDGELMSAAGNSETFTTDGFANENVVRDDYFYGNPADGPTDVDGNPTENRYGAATDSGKPDEYGYYQNAADSAEERPENQYAADSRGEPYAAIDDGGYRYRNRPRDEENPDDPADYRVNGYESQRPRADGDYGYYDYQNSADATGHPAEYAEPRTNLVVDQTAAVGHDQYYYRNDTGPDEPSDGNYYGDRGYRDQGRPSDQQRYGAVDDRGYYGYREPDDGYGDTTAAAEELQGPYYPDEARPDNSVYEPLHDGYDESNDYYRTENADNEGRPADGNTEDGQSAGETANQLRSEKQ